MFSPNISFDYFVPTTNQYTIGTSAIPEIDLNVKIYPYWFKEMTLTWDIPPFWANKEPRFNVYRGENETVGFHKLTSIPLTAPQYLDNSTRESSMSSKEYYIIEAILNDGSTWKTAPTSVGDKIPDWHELRAREISRREWILLKKFAGNDALVFRQIRYGRYCPNCYDRTAEKLVKDYCTTCYGTGIDGGYYPGIRTKIQFDASTNSLTYTYFGKFEQNQIGGWTIAVPDIEPKDIILRMSDYRMYEVGDVNTTELLNKPIRQIMRLEEQPKERVIYELIKREGLLP